MWARCKALSLATRPAFYKEDVWLHDTASSNSKTRYQSSAKTGSTKFNNFQQRDKKSDDWYNSLLSNNN